MFLVFLLLHCKVTYFISASSLLKNWETLPSKGETQEKDLKFKFSSDNSIGFDYVVIGKKKFTLDDEKSEANGKYMLYKEAKILGTDGIVNYKMRLVGSSKFSVEGTFVKKK